MHKVEADHLEVERRCRDEFGVDRHQVILATDLQTVAGVEEYGDRRTAHLIGKPANDAIHRGLVEVVSLRHFKSVAFERRSDVGRVVLGVRQQPCVLVGGIADHQRDPTLCVRGRHSGKQ